MTNKTLITKPTGRKEPRRPTGGKEPRRPTGGKEPRRPAERPVSAAAHKKSNPAGPT